MRSQTVYNAVITMPDFQDAKVGVYTHAGKLAAIEFLPYETCAKRPDNSISQQVVHQLTSYFSNRTFKFSVPLLAQGTAFQYKVWQALLTIQAGETLSYGDIANQLRSSARAVGNACRANPIPIVVPCHRIVAKQGIGGYCGRTNGQRLRIKQWLLDHERG